MIIVVPKDFTVVNVDATNESYDSWNIATSFLKDGFCINKGLIYKALEDNTGKEPPSVYWLNKGSTNKNKMTDKYLTTKTAELNSLKINCSKVDTLVLLEVDAAQIEIVTSLGEEILTTQSFSMIETASNSYSSYCFEDAARKRMLVVDLPIAYDLDIEITFNGSSGNASLGKLFVGNKKNLGFTKVEIDLGENVFNGYVADELGTFPTQELTVKYNSFEVSMLREEVDRNFNILSSLKGKEALFMITNKYEVTNIYGIYTEKTFRLRAKNREVFSLTVESII